MNKLYRLVVAIMIAAGSIFVSATGSEAYVTTGYALYTQEGNMRCLYRDEAKALEVLSDLRAEDPRWYPDPVPTDYDPAEPLWTDDPNFTPTYDPIPQN